MMTAVVVTQAIVIALLAVLVAGLLRSHAEILRRLHELGVGDDQPTSIPLSPTRRPSGRRPPALQASPAAITGMTPQGATVSVALEESRGYTLVAFLSSGCGTCKTFWAEFATPGHNTPRDDVRTIICTKSAVDESIADVRRLAPSDPLTVMSTEAWDAFSVPFTPYFALVDTERGAIVGDGAAAGWQQLVGLVERALGDAADMARLDRSTGERLTDSDEELRRAGIEPGDPVLYRRPVDGGR